MIEHRSFSCMLLIVIVVLPGQCFGGSGWVDSVVDLRSGGQADNADQEWGNICREYPIECDWVLQDGGEAFQRWCSGVSAEFDFKIVKEKVFAEIGDDRFAVEYNRVMGDGDLRGGLELYVKACQVRRGVRLASMIERYPKIVFASHKPLGGSHYAYTEGQSDAQSESNFTGGSRLCLLEMDGMYGKVKTLLKDDVGVIRDPDVSYDGERVLFAWKKSKRGDDYHLYEMKVSSGAVRQLTSGEGVADYEGVYLPNGDIVFNSSRCVQTVDCWWTEVSNLYTCDGDGRFLRRLTYDQVHTNYPTVLDDGRVIYSKWEYNDRGQIYPQPLFQMNYDGTGQTEFYGNNSYFPTSILHARGMPGSQKVVGIASGHHTMQAGKLIMIDTAKGRQENAGVTLLAPVRETPAQIIDQYGQQGDLFQYPYAISDSEFLVSYCGDGWAGIGATFGDHNHRRKDLQFGIYYMRSDGGRELLAWDDELSCNRPVPMARRSKPAVRPSEVDYRLGKGSYYMQDVYVGPGLAGVKLGTIKKLRVVGLEYRSAGIGYNNNGGAAGGALISTPIAIGNGTWDVKVVLGEANIYADGSAFFEVPANVPVYFQAVDEDGHVAATMRSWSTLQPGEMFSCVGCHENKSEVPGAGRRITMAIRKGVQKLDGFYGGARGFSFIKEIQPILDEKCVSCHNDRSLKGPCGLAYEAKREGDDADADSKRSFSLRGDKFTLDTSRRKWSDGYFSLTGAYKQGDCYRGRNSELVNWIDSQTGPSMLKPYSSGSAKSGLVDLLRDGHEGVEVTEEEIDLISCWIDLGVPYCGDYVEANDWNEQEMAKHERYFDKRRQYERIDAKNVADLVSHRAND